MRSIEINLPDIRLRVAFSRPRAGADNDRGRARLDGRWSRGDAVTTPRFTVMISLAGESQVGWGVRLAADSPALDWSQEVYPSEC